MAEHEPTQATPRAQPSNNISVNKLPDEPGNYVASMTCIFNAEKDKTAPYHFDLQCMGIFHADETLTEDEALRGVTITAHNVLYGSIRECVAWLTGRQVYGPLILGLSVLHSSAKPSKESATRDASSKPEILNK